MIVACVVIQRPIQGVFSFYRSFENLPKLLGDVMLMETGRVTNTSYDVTGKFT